MLPRLFNGTCIRHTGQLLSYLIVIDFESTCWENRKGFQEISELSLCVCGGGGGGGGGVEINGR